ncbi:MAG TPA: nucleotidyltransferase family protein [Bryobacteraceae bacterium]
MAGSVTMTSTQSTEHELLRICANYELSETALETIRRIAGNANWDYVEKTAWKHGLVPLLYRNLSRACPDLVPMPVLSRLGQAYVANAAHNLRLTGELLRIIDILKAAGIQAVPFKGPVLADFLFGNVALRQFSDIDILIRQGDVRKAKHLLLADGYRSEFDLNPKSENEYIRSEHAFQLRKQNLGFVVELHWRFGSRNQLFPVKSSEIRSRLLQRTFQGGDILTLCREDLLLYLCAHGAKHGWERLEWIACVCQLIRLPDQIDWDAVMDRAGRRGARRALYVGLLLAGELSQLVIPEAVSEAMFSDPAARALAHQARSCLFKEQPDHSRREVYRQTYYLRTRERLFDRARILLYCSARIPHPLAKDWSLFRIPAGMSFLYYLLRPLRLLRDHGFRGLRAMLDPNTTF